MTNTNPLGYGKCSPATLIQHAREIASYLKKDDLSPISIKINAAFFGGGPLEPKSFSNITSFIEPSITQEYFYRQEQEQFFIERRFSDMKFLGCLESIPLSGTFIAAVSLMTNFLLGVSEYATLKNRITKFESTNQSSQDISRLAKDVLNSAIDLTEYGNKFVGSMLALIPLLKPIVRIAQVIFYNINYSDKKPAPWPPRIEITELPRMGVLVR